MTVASNDIFTAWKTLEGRSSTSGLAYAGGAGQVTDLILFPNTAAAVAAAGSAGGAFYLDPADYPGGTRTLQLRIVAWIVTCSVQSLIDFTFALKPVATWGGGSNVDPTVATVGTAVTSTTISSPPASTGTFSAASAVSFPTLGFYVVTLSSSAANTANAALRYAHRLQYRHTA